MSETAGDVFTVRDIRVYAGSRDTALAFIKSHALAHRQLRVHLVNSYSVGLAKTHRAFAAALSTADMNLPDGTPIAWIGRLETHSPFLRPLRGPDIMARCLREGLQWGAEHYFIGGSRESLENLRRKLEGKYVGIRIAGMDAPWAPDVEAPTMREAALRASAASPNYVWVGLGTPKQDLFMDVYSRFISAPMIGVGAAFDFEEGAVPVAPSWSHGRGIEWLFRLAAEPRRLARRYLIVSLAVIPSLVSALVRRIFRL